MPMRGDLEEDDRLHREQIGRHLNPLRAAVSETWVELASDRLGLSDRERLARSLLRIEVEIGRLERLPPPLRQPSPSKSAGL